MGKRAIYNAVLEGLNYGRETSQIQKNMDQTEVLGGTALEDCVIDSMSDLIVLRFAEYVEARAVITNQGTLTRKFLLDCVEEFVNGLLGSMMEKMIDRMKGCNGSLPLFDKKEGA